MKPTMLATADRFPIDPCLERPVLRFAPRGGPTEIPAPPSTWALVLAWLLVALVPFVGGRFISMTLDEPLLGVIAAMLALIPLMMALCPRARSGGRDRFHRR